MVLIIGVAGAIASGKSTACRLLSEQGAVHCDADKLVHRMYDPGKPAFDRIIIEFGKDVVGEDGFIDRKILGGKVFGNPDKMSKLTKAIGNIKEEIEGVMKQWRHDLKDDDIALMEAVNFMDSGYGRYSDLTWLFAVDDDVALKRLMERNNLDMDAAQQRLSSQRHWTERKDGADIITHNNGTIEELISIVNNEIINLKTNHKNKSLTKSKYTQWWESQNN
tara:strand:+ start:117 stop:779 length:663 start_codon:yes stop_codon:yes gene_type:complete